jgi:Kef-type K+ transport system membrane component KefB
MASSDVFLVLALILIAAKLGGLVSRQVGLPAVFGQLCAGVLLGPTAFGLLRSSSSLALGSELGAVILLFVAGLETDVAGLRRLGGAAVATAVGGVALPFAAGVALAGVFGLPITASLFVGALLTATSVSISVEALRDLGHLQSRVGTTILGAAVIDDVLGLIILAVVAAARGGANGILPLVHTALFLPLAALVGLIAVPPLGRWAARQPIEQAGLMAALAIALLYAWSAETVGNMAAITGAYLAGLSVARSEIRGPAIDGAKALGYGLLIPVFFVSVGAAADLHGVGQSSLVFVALLIGAAVVTKACGCALGARAAGLTGAEALQVGVGMVARGEVALVVAALGRAIGALDGAVYAAAVAMTLVTTLLTPLLLRLTFIEDPTASAPTAGYAAAATEGG